MGLWCRCSGPGRSLSLALGGSGLGGQFAGGGAGRRLPGWVGSEGEAGYRGERGERGRGEQDVVEPAGGGRAGGVVTAARAAGGPGRLLGAGAGGHSGGQPGGGAGRAGRPAPACKVAAVTREA